MASILSFIMQIQLKILHDIDKNLLLLSQNFEVIWRATTPLSLGMQPGSKFYSPGTRHLSPHHPRLPVISGQLRSWSVKSTVDRPTVKFSVTRYSTSFPILFS